MDFSSLSHHHYSTQNTNQQTNSPFFQYLQQPGISSDILSLDESSYSLDLEPFIHQPASNIQPTDTPSTNPSFQPPHTFNTHNIPKFKDLDDLTHFAVLKTLAAEFASLTANQKRQRAVDLPPHLAFPLFQEAQQLEQEVASLNQQIQVAFRRANIHPDIAQKSIDHAMQRINQQADADFRTAKAMQKQLAHLINKGFCDHLI